LFADKEFHLKIQKGDIGKYVILCGDPFRVPTIANYLDNAYEVAFNREYNIYTGYLNGEKVSVCSHGIGGPSTAIATEELIHCGAEYLIRVGTSGGMHEKVLGGDIVIATGAIRSGTCNEYLPSNYPAVPDYQVLNALVNAAKTISSDENGNRFHVGVVHCKDSFYGETNPETMPVETELINNWNAFIRAGCLTSEMESDTLFSVGSCRGVKTGAVFTALWNVEHAKHGGDKDIYVDNCNRAIICAIEAMKLLISENADKEVL
jgi:uridine phosphorylase